MDCQCRLCHPKLLLGVKIMNTCDTCKHWDRQPDHVFQPTEYQKPVGPPLVTVFGVCRAVFLSCGMAHPLPNGLTSDYGYHIGGETDIYTGPKFGCVHWEASEAYRLKMYDEASYDPTYGMKKP